MDNSIKSVVKSFQQATMDYLGKNSDNGVLKFLKSSVSTMERLLRAIDTVLKEDGIDVKGSLEKIETYGKEKGKNLFSTISALANKDSRAPALASLKDKALSIKTKIKDQFASDTEGAAGPPDAQGQSAISPMGILQNLSDRMQALSGNIQQLTEATNDKIDTDEEKHADTKKSRLQRMKDSFGKLFSRQQKKDDEVENEKKGFFGKKKDGKGKDDKPGGFLGSILGAVTGGIGFLAKTVFGLGTRLLVGLAPLIGRAVVGALTTVAPFLGTTIAKGLSTITGGALGKIFSKKALMGGLKMVGRAAVGIGGTALRLGAAAIATPVGGAVAIAAGVALAVYGGYKLYKYLNRNSIADSTAGKLTRLRLLTYGFNDTHRDHYSKLFDLEMLMKDYASYKSGKISYKPYDKVFKDKVMDIFSIERSDKEKYNILNQWFMKRFTPAYHNFMQALWDVNSKIYLDDLDKLTPDEIFKLVSNYRLPTQVFDRKQIPVPENPVTSMTIAEAETMLASIRQEAMKKSKMFEGKDPKDLQKQTQKEADKTNKEQQDKSKALDESKKASIPSPQAQNQSKGSGVGIGSTDPSKIPSPHQEGEPKPKETNQNSADAILSKSTARLNMASGPITPGDKSLQGVATKLDKSKIYNLDPNVFDLFSGMAREYNTLTGKMINVNEAFRSYADQAALYKQMPGKAAKPGNSTHELGLALDINTPDANELEKLGLMRKYGFTRPIGGETWHIEPAGVAVNPGQAKSDLQSRIARVLSSPGRGGGGYGIEPGSTLKRRNTALQMELYKNGTTVPIDPQKEVDPAKNPSSVEPPKTMTGGTQSSSSSSQGAVISTSPTPPPQVSVSNPIQEQLQAKPSSGRVVGGIAAPSIANTNFYGKKPEIPSVTPQGLDKRPSDTTDISKNLDMGQFQGEMSPEQAIKKASQVVGVSPDTMITFAKLESSMNPNAKAKTSSATGLFQITSGTWEMLMKKYGKEFNIPADAKPTHPYYNSLLGAAYAKDNLQSVKSFSDIGISKDVRLYIAHHFGAGGANKMLSAMRSNPNAPIQSAVSPDAYMANRGELGNKTVGQYAQFLQGKLNKAGSTSSSTYQGGKQEADTSSKPPASPSLQAERDRVTNSGLYKSPEPKAPEVSTAPSGPPPSIFTPPPVVSRAQPVFPAEQSIPQPQAQQQPSISMQGTEKILGEQLTTLNRIATILESIDSKTSSDGKKEQTSESQPQKPQDPIVAKTQDRSSSNFVSMKRVVI